MLRDNKQRNLFEVVTTQKIAPPPGVGGGTFLCAVAIGIHARQSCLVLSEVKRNVDEYYR